MNKKIILIKKALNNRKYLESKKLLNELENDLKRLKEFSIKIKRMARNTGRMRSIDVSDLEPLFVKYNIKFKDEN
jgi:hypothetical protein